LSSLAVERFAAHLLAWRALLATLLVADMALAVAHALTLDITREALGALDLLLLGPAAAGLHHHLQARGTVPTMASEQGNLSAFINRICGAASY
jgi:hypothetical protein